MEIVSYYQKEEWWTFQNGNILDHGVRFTCPLISAKNVAMKDTPAVFSTFCSYFITTCLQSEERT
ncbi:hypothetical protein KP79_PYT07852 [Mizuhopecten yessoensis]|uniref:Uncharacterized protein n=1 Tax=Mizuhopecten yessoensis TaxID=6573 RepID=A0A210Q9Z9_MIZYE|nr:hypothetical protein KP79_PYT07852 [Mizuhopecten yessoensis]